MTRQRALRLAREWAQGHVCSIRDGEAAEYHSMFVAMLEESMSNEPLTCEGCKFEYEATDEAMCEQCIRSPAYRDYYRRPPEGEEDT